MLHSLSIPGLFITGTDTEIGKTMIAGAIADWFRRHGAKVAVCKPAASGCVRRREGLVSEDAEFLAHCADTPFPLDLVCPQRFLEPLTPAIAAERAGTRLDWSAIQRSLDLMSRSSDLMIVEGVGGLMAPMDDRYTVLDIIQWLKLPAVVVARPNLGTINHTLLTVNTLRAHNVPVAGVVINRYPADTPPPAEETNPRAIERWGKVKVLCLVPDDKPGQLTPAIRSAVDQVDWRRMLSPASPV